MPRTTNEISNYPEHRERAAYIRGKIDGCDEALHGTITESLWSNNYIRTVEREVHSGDIYQLARVWYYRRIRLIADGLITECRVERGITPKPAWRGLGAVDLAGTPNDEGKIREWMDQSIANVADCDITTYTLQSHIALLASDNDDAYGERFGERATGPMAVEAEARCAIEADLHEILAAREDEWLTCDAPESEPEGEPDPSDNEVDLAGGAPLDDTSDAARGTDPTAYAPPTFAELRDAGALGEAEERDPTAGEHDDDDDDDDDEPDAEIHVLGVKTPDVVGPRLSWSGHADPSDVEAAAPDGWRVGWSNLYVDERTQRSFVPLLLRDPCEDSGAFEAAAQLAQLESLVTFEVEPEPERYLAVRGHFATDDAAADRALEDEIVRRLDRGDPWAWCVVVVRARWGEYVGISTLGACSYLNRADWNRCEGATMREDALTDLVSKVPGGAAAILGGGSE